VPFRKYAGSFTPEQLEILTTAFNAAIADVTIAGVEIPQSDLARRILDRAADGIFDVTELKRAALNPDWQRNSQNGDRVTSRPNDATPVPLTQNVPVQRKVAKIICEKRALDRTSRCASPLGP
jgi:hypothetical protein